MLKAQAPITNTDRKTSNSNKNSTDDTDILDYGKAGAIAEEVLSAIRIVTSFGGQDQIVKWYVCNVCTYVCVYVCMYVHMYVYMYVANVCIHTYMDTTSINIASYVYS